MKKIVLKKLENTDKKCFAKWWRDKDLIKSTSGKLKRISDCEVSTIAEQLRESGFF